MYTTENRSIDSLDDVSDTDEMILTKNANSVSNMSEFDSTGPESTQVHLDLISKKEFIKLHGKVIPATIASL